MDSPVDNLTMTLPDHVSSPFFHPGSIASRGSLAILQLRRDHLIPSILQDAHQGETEYKEGHVVNTRFGSYPHSTLIGLPWGSQVLASQVDTGSRGRKGDGGRGKKRKLDEISKHDGVASEEHDSGITPQEKINAPLAAATGFCHILPPTPETWTLSLPHRTQVVYTPDYSFILQKLQARPGSVVIEAGAGSGSFTHAAARAVFDGYSTDQAASNGAKSTPHGKVYSFEYHEPRAIQLQSEVESHGLASIVRVTNRDVYTNGFLLPPATITENPDLDTNGNDSPASSTTDSLSPCATQVFLDLPAPWLALPHLSRTAPSPLNPLSPVHLCGFLPCIEQAQRTIAGLRAHGWTEVSMFELVHRRLDVRRERVGLSLEGLRGVNATPATVEEAVERLVEVEKSARIRMALSAVAGGGTPQAKTKDRAGNAEGKASTVLGNGSVMQSAHDPHPESRAARLVRIAEEQKRRRPWQDGRLVVRTEPEIKTHTSYLVFAVLPVEWTTEMEERSLGAWPISRETVTPTAETGETANEGQDGIGGDEPSARKKSKGKRR